MRNIYPNIEDVIVISNLLHIRVTCQDLSNILTAGAKGTVHCSFDRVMSSQGARELV